MRRLVLPGTTATPPQAATPGPQFAVAATVACHRGSGCRQADAIDAVHVISVGYK